MTPANTNNHAPHLLAKRLGIDTYLEPIVFMHADCPVCRSEGFEAHTRIKLTSHTHAVIATLNVVRSSLVSMHEAGLSEAAWRALHLTDGEHITLSHPDPLESFSAVRGKIYGRDITDAEFGEIINDVVAGRFSNIELAAFVTACAGERMSRRDRFADPRHGRGRRAPQVGQGRRRRQAQRRRPAR